MNKVELKKIRTNSDEVCGLLDTLAHRSRLLAVCFIGDGEKSVKEIEDFVGGSQSAVSQHLAKLRLTGVLTTRKSANRVLYRIGDPRVLDLVGELKRIYC